MRLAVTFTLCLALASAAAANMYEVHGPTIFVVDKPVRFTAESNSPGEGDVLMAFDEAHVRARYEEQLRHFEETMEEEGRTIDDFRMGAIAGDVEAAVDTQPLEGWSEYDEAGPGLGHSTSVTMNVDRSRSQYRPGTRYFFMVCRVAHGPELEERPERICSPTEGMVAVTSACTAAEVAGAMDPFLELLNDAETAHGGDQLVITDSLTDRLESVESAYAGVEARCPELLGHLDRSEASAAPGEVVDRLEECNTRQCKAQERFIGAAHLTDKENLRVRAKSLALLRTVLMENFRNTQRRMDALGVDAASGSRLRRNIQGYTLGRKELSARLRSTQRLGIEDPQLETVGPYVDEGTFGRAATWSGLPQEAESDRVDPTKLMAALQLSARTEGGFGDLLWTAGKFAAGAICAPVTLGVGAVETVNHAAHGRWTEAAVGTLSTTVGVVGYFASGTDLGSQAVHGAAAALGVATTAGSVISAGSKIARGDY